MQFEYDPEQLIEEVRKRPGIWDYKNCPEYKSKIRRRKLWVEVVQAMVGDRTVTKYEFRELEIRLQKRWKSIKDCYMKYKMYGKTKRPYVYAKRLQFLQTKYDDVDQTPGVPETSRNYSESDTEDRKPRIKSRKIEKFQLASSDDEDRDGMNPTNSTSAIGSVPNFAFASVEDESHDPDKLFLLSLMPHLKSVPEEMRLNVKMDMMNVLQNAIYVSKRSQV